MRLNMSISALLILSLYFCGASVVEECPQHLGGGVCPIGNTCCLLHDFTSGCVPNDLGSHNATCCRDNGRTACAVGYDCIAGACHAGPSVHDPLVQVLPRYRLCHVAANELRHVHAFPVRSSDHKDYHLAYYSSDGGTNAPSRAVVVVHGAGRNADDYFCTLRSVVEKAQDKEETWVVAPHFLAVQDDNPFEKERDNFTTTLLRWNDTDLLGGDNPWRYGAHAVTHGTMRPTPVSSFEAMDQLVDWLLSFVKHVTVVGHSAGGQFVQRWALLTPLPHRFRAVVANPSSYAYGSPERFDEFTHQWVVPETKETKCLLYNHWEWGLEIDEHPIITPPYVQKVLAQYDATQLLERFADRDVVYLAGGLDVCNVSHYDKNGWCYSHGLETTCMDQLQGSNRLARHLHAIDALQRKGVAVRHAIVPGVGHDHSLMFHSAPGLKAILGPEDDLWSLQ
jgi:pimeloyl-ACP methyl ester carboxylesterase